MDYQKEFLLAVKNDQLPKVSALCASKSVDINKTDQVFLCLKTCTNYLIAHYTIYDY